MRPALRGQTHGNDGNVRNQSIKIMPLNWVRPSVVAGIIWFSFLTARGDIILSGSIQWDGNVAHYLDGPAPFYAEGSLARRLGVKAIAKDVLPGFPAHTIGHLNDGVYGNGNSWIGNSVDSWAGLDLGSHTRLTAFAFGRDNTSGGLTERTSGSYQIQYTRSVPVGTGSSWTNIGTIVYTNSTSSSSRRHQFTLIPPVEATGFRIIAPSGACIDEIELYDTVPAVLGSPWLTSGRFGQALSTGIRAPHWGEVRLDSSYQQRPLTVEAWVKLNSAVDNNIIVAAGFKQFAGCWMLASDINTGNCCAYLPGSLPAMVNTGQNIVDGQWHYVAMVLETARLRLYVDGVQMADAALSPGSLPASGSSPANHPGGLYIGAYPPDHQGCDGLVDEVRISNATLSISGVPTAAFQAGVSTIGLWHFDQFTNGGFSDGSTKANPARLAPPPANPLLKLYRGITFDRLYFGIQAQAMFTLTDVNMVKSMGFDHIKILVDPATHKSGSGINPATMPTLKTNVDLALSSGLPVVVCIHPQANFKNAELGNAAEFNNYLGFMNAFAQWLATNYPPNQIAFEFMTEPFGNYADWTVMQYRIWEAVRMAMPNHMLILSGDQTGRLFGLLGVHPVNDSNVLYCFTTYDPFPFTFQGGSPFGDPIKYLQDVPYPSNPSVINSSLTNIIANVPAASKAAAQQSLLNYGEQSWDANVLNARFKRLADWNRFFGGQLQLWCAEFGCLDPGQGGVKATDRYAFISDLRQAFETNGIWWAYWSFNETFTVLLPARVPLHPKPSALWKDQQMLDSLGIACTNCPAGYSVQWDGNDGQFSGASVPDNVALARKGGQAFGSGQLFPNGGPHDIDNVIDGFYGNGSSWISGSEMVPTNVDVSAGPFVGVRFTNTIAISSIAWGRENTITAQTGGYPDRWQGTYTLQVTTVVKPDASTTETGNPTTGWVTLGTVAYSDAQTSPTFRPWMRHRYDVAQGGNPIQATGLRIKVSWDAIAIDEIEVYALATLFITGQAISWTGGGVLRAADEVTGPWIDVAGATNPMTFSPTPGNRKFFRVKQ